MSQKPPQRIEAPDSGSNPATFIFLHGFGDDADGWTSIAQQFHTARKLPHLTWLFPTAPLNHEAMTTAWYTPHSFSPIPVGRSSASQDLEKKEESDSEEEAEDEIFASVEYVCSLIDGEVSRGVKLERIVVGGFSQGCAISLVTGLASRYAGRLGAVVGLSGYLIGGKRAREGRRGYLRSNGKEEGNGNRGMKVFLAHGTKDMLVPMRVFRKGREKVEGALGEVEVHEYEGLGHATSGVEFRDMCEFLERVVPP